MKKEDLIRIAKANYPIGTKYICAASLKEDGDMSANTHIVESDNWEVAAANDVVFGETGKGCLYYKGTWARKVESPENSGRLVHGKIYTVNDPNGKGNIFMWDKYPNVALYYTSSGRTGFAKDGGNFDPKKAREATDYERTWLFACITEDKFVPESELYLYSDQGIPIDDILFKDISIITTSSKLNSNSIIGTTIITNIDKSKNIKKSINIIKSVEIPLLTKTRKYF